MRVGVIGIGKMGENHLRTYLSLDNHCQLVGIYDNDEKKGNEVADKYKVKQFNSIENLLKSVDAVSIAVPTEFHYEIGLLCVQYNVHMLMEKPVTDSVEQAKDLLHKANRTGVKFQVGHIELFNPLISVLANELENEKIIGMDFHRMSPYDEKNRNVDVVKDLMIHDLYILEELLKDKIVESYTLGKTLENTPKHAVVITRSSEGVIAKLTASFKSKRKIRTIQILTEDAFIEVDILNNNIRIKRDTITQNIKLENNMLPLSIQLLDFINCIKLDKIPSVSGEDGIRTLKTTNEISNAIKKGIT
ncbi:Gfo/Idh/MocA family protein [Aquibacillus rhizosphaerae]|uniref:Gfo/Idh/MocA family oxidoreductase n=1 Tax=Aquibacillus rhizosphaerae TaxID=3051431 RepID=A0ABT7L1R1_9BACI|nr:Gfo/Idh/MocA family oxidoreductase [Aquibacillus sp. LR5S19]MDL4839758.1 Gfo/Idh/MocA family oxidoreductase [Aquibacillus sp. LR5S19]